MPWVRASLRGQIVYAEVREGGAFADDRGRVEVRYKAGRDGEEPPAGPKRYSALVANLGPAPEGAEAQQPARTRAKAAATPADAPAKPRAPRARVAKPKAAAPSPTALPADAVLIYTDGACTGNPGPAGLGVVVVGEAGNVELSEYLGHGTNNIAELTAVLRGVELAADRPGKLVIHTDSQYAIGVLTKGWKAKANVELIAQIKAALKARGGVELRYVKGHAGIPLNERCDELARQAVSTRRTARSDARARA